MSQEEPNYGYSGSLEKDDSPEDLDSFPVDYDVRLRSLIEQKNIAISTYYSVINEIKGMAEGGDAGGIREKYYKEWIDHHFQKLLEELGEK